MGHCPPEKEQACVLRVQNGPCGVGNLSLCSPYRGSKSLSNNVHKESSYFFQTSRSIPIYPHIHMLLVSPSPLITTTIFSSLHLSYKQKLKLALCRERLGISYCRGKIGQVVPCPLLWARYSSTATLPMLCTGIRAEKYASGRRSTEIAGTC